MIDTCLTEQRAVELLSYENAFQLIDKLRQVVAVYDFPMRAFRERELAGDFSIREDHDVVPPQPTLGPAAVSFNELPQRVAGIAGLPDRIDLVIDTASTLPPCLAVMRYFAALDFETDDVGTLDRDDEVDFVILKVVADSLTR